MNELINQKLEEFWTGNTLENSKGEREYVWTPNAMRNWFYVTLTEVYQRGREDEAIDHQCYCTDKGVIELLEKERRDTLMEVREALQYMIIENVGDSAKTVDQAITLVTELLGSDKTTEV